MSGTSSSSFLIWVGVPAFSRITSNAATMNHRPGPPSVSPLEAPITAAAVPPPPPPMGNSLNGQPIPPSAPVTDAPPPGDGGALPAAPSSFGTTAPAGRPKVAVAEYNPRTGQYVGSDGKLYTVTNLAMGVPLPKTWQDLLPH